MIDLLPLVAAASSAAEYPAARTLALLLSDTAIVPPASAWKAFRKPMARLARDAARQLRVDAQTAEEGHVLEDFAADLDRSAWTLEREALREEWLVWSRFRREHRKHLDIPTMRATMRRIWREYHYGPV